MEGMLKSYSTLIFSGVFKNNNNSVFILIKGWTIWSEKCPHVWPRNIFFSTIIGGYRAGVWVSAFLWWLPGPLKTNWLQSAEGARMRKLEGWNEMKRVFPGGKLLNIKEGQEEFTEDFLKEKKIERIPRASTVRNTYFNARHLYSLYVLLKCSENALNPKCWEKQQFKPLHQLFSKK